MGKKKKLSTRLNMPPATSSIAGHQQQQGGGGSSGGGQQPPELNRSCSVPAEKFAKALNSHYRLPTSPEESSGINTGYVTGTCDFKHTFIF